MGGDGFSKIAGREAFLARSRADIPNATLQMAFDWAKLNLADMRRGDAAIRRNRQF